MTVHDDSYFMALAIEQAQFAFDKGEVPVGAVIVRDNTIIGRGFNQPIFTCDPSAHAEIVALRDAATNEQNYRLPGATLYITIEPCTMCLGAMVHSRIARIVYGATEPKAGVLDSHNHLIESGVFNHEFEWRGGVLAEECGQLIQTFFKKRRDEKKAVKKGA